MSLRNLPVFNQGLNVITMCASEGNAAYHDLNIWSSHSLQRPFHPRNICDVELQQNCFVWSSRICGCSAILCHRGFLLTVSYIWKLKIVKREREQPYNEHFQNQWYSGLRVRID